MFDDIVKAINGRKLLTIYYPPGTRLVEPYAFGYGSKGQLLLRAFQVEGASESGCTEGWKLFRFDRMGSVEIGGSFSPTRPEYRCNDKMMKGGIIAQI